MYCYWPSLFHESPGTTPPLRRSARAAVAAGARVERAFEILGADLPDHLREAGELRLAHKQASLEELGIPDTEAGLSPDLLDL